MLNKSEGRGDSLRLGKLGGGGGVKKLLLLPPSLLKKSFFFVELVQPRLNLQVSNNGCLSKNIFS